MVGYGLVGLAETSTGYGINRWMIVNDFDPFLSYAVPAVLTGFFIGFLLRKYAVFHA